MEKLSLVSSNSISAESLLMTPSEEKDEILLKEKVLEYALDQRNLTLVAQLGKSEHGFIQSSLRAKCWYFLLKSQYKINSKEIKEVNSNESEIHMDENQVHLDTERSFTDIKEKRVKDVLKQVLQYIILKVLRKYPELHYYQGYHDVISVFVLVFVGNRILTDEKISPSNILDMDSNWIFSIITEEEEKYLFVSVEAFTLLYLRDFMMDSLDFSIDQLSIIPRLVKTQDPILYKKLRLDKVEPVFAISSILTIFSHEIRPGPTDYSSDYLFEIFDLIISTQNMKISLIMYAQLIIDNRNIFLKEYDENVINFDNTVDLVHVIIQKVLVQAFLNDESWRNTLKKTRLSQYTWKIDVNQDLVNKYSVLLTTASGTFKYIKSFSKDKVYWLLTKEVQINKQRNIASAKKKDQLRNSKRPSWYHIYGISIFIGVVATVMYILNEENQLQLLTRSMDHDISRLLESHFNAYLTTANHPLRKFLGALLNIGPKS